MSIFNRKNKDEDLDLMQEDLDWEQMEMDSMDEDEMYSPYPAEMEEDGSGGIGGLAGFRYSDHFMLIICLVLALILMCASGLLIYKTHALSAENGKLETRAQRDTKLKKSESEYEAETENLEAETDTLINRYGAGNTPEKTILFLANLSSTSGISVTSVEFGSPEVITEDENGNRLKGAADAPDPSEAVDASSGSDGQEDSDQNRNAQNNGDKKKKKSSGEYYLYKYQTTISYTGSYAELKKAIKFIEDYGERTTVNDITSTYDETTQNLTGSMTLNMYTLSGTAQEYRAPSVSGSVGTANIFG